jgi:hypothetical protein
MKMKKFLALFLSAVCLSISTKAQIRTGEKIKITEAIEDDLYIAGGNITIQAPIHGDLIVAGGTIIVEDTVRHDILVAGGNIILKGFVGDDIRCAGGTVALSNSVAGDLVITGGVITVQKNCAIGGDILSSGGQVAIHGDVNGNIKNASGEFTFTGKVNRNMDARADKILIDGVVGGNSTLAANTIEVGSSAKFHQDVKYWNKPESVDFGNSLIGKATFDPGLMIEGGKWHYLGFATFLAVIWYLGTALLMIVLIQYLFGKAFRRAANAIRETSIKSFGFGLLFLVGTPIAILLCFITIVPIPIGIVMLLGYITVLLFATVIVALLISNWINNTYYETSWGDSRIMVVAFGIFVILKLASLTPFVGPVLLFIAAAMGFGGILLTVRWRRTGTLALT